MADEFEDELGFDPTLKKKKKKKKTKGDDDAGEAPPETPEVEDAPAEENVDADLDAEFGKKKKKKKKKEFVDEDADDDTAAAAAGADPGEDDIDIDLDAEFGKKKKKKKKVTISDEPDESSTDGPAPAAAAAAPQSRAAWADSDRDYTYEELLETAFDIMRAKNPDMTAEKKKFVMKPPLVTRVGTRRSAFVNFTEICKLLHRQPDHLLGFLLAELGTSGSIDGSDALVVKGRFQQKQIENVLRRYIREYVTCHTCRSPETTLIKENRLFFLKCEVCGSKCSVAGIKSGFQAVTGKRAALRAKAAT